MKNAKADSEPSRKRWVRNDSRSVERVSFGAAVVVEIEDAALKERRYKRRRASKERVRRDELIAR